jgi:acyl carrier protein
MGEGPKSPGEIFEMLKRIISTEFDLPAEEIALHSTFEDLDMDSIDAVDLAVSVEEEIGFQFESDDLGELRTLEDVVGLIHGGRSRAAH